MDADDKGKEYLDKGKDYFNKGMKVLKDAFDKGVEVSKSALNKAGDVVQDFGDKSVMRIEKHQFESKRNEHYALLGKKVAEKFINDNAVSVQADDAELSSIVDEIKRFGEEIAKREELLSQEQG